MSPGPVGLAAGRPLGESIMIVDLRKTENCFVCGPKNAAGLRVDFEVDTEARSIRGTFTPRAEHEGWENIVHGGIIAALMDEAMVKLAAHLGMAAMSAEMTVKFKVPAHAGEEVVVQGRIVESRHRLLLAEATIERGPVVIAEATGKLLKIQPNRT